MEQLQKKRHEPCFFAVFHDKKNRTKKLTNCVFLFVRNGLISDTKPFSYLRDKSIPLLQQYSTLLSINYMDRVFHTPTTVHTCH